MRNLTHRWPQSGHFFPQLGHVFPIFEKGRKKLPTTQPPSPSSYAPVESNTKKSKTTVSWRKCCYYFLPFSVLAVFCDLFTIFNSRAFFSSKYFAEIFQIFNVTSGQSLCRKQCRFLVWKRLSPSAGKISQLAHNTMLLINLISVFSCISSYSLANL